MYEIHPQFPDDPYRLAPAMRQAADALGPHPDTPRLLREMTATTRGSEADPTSTEPTELENVSPTQEASTVEKVVADIRTLSSENLIRVIGLAVGTLRERSSEA